MCEDQILENHNADLQHDADEAHAALTDFESKRDAFKLKVRQAAIRATTLMQWKLAVGLVQVDRAKQDAKQVPPLSLVWMDSQHAWCIAYWCQTSACKRRLCVARQPADLPIAS